MEEQDRNDLRTAVRLLENPGVGFQLVNLLGYPIEGLIKFLPKWIRKAIGRVITKVIAATFRTALSTVEKKTHQGSSRFIHQALVVASGAVGGFFGFPGMMVELPFSTALMLRSIADIAQSEGEDLSSTDTKLACITVFALGGRANAGSATDTAYYAVRAALTRTLSKAAEFIAERGIAEEGAPIVIRVMANLASRFGILVTDKMAAEMVPLLGAFGGASINLLFIKHFQNAARGHFIVRRLEKKYGGEFVKEEYEKLLERIRKGNKG